MQPHSVFSLTRRLILARLQEEEEDLVPLVAQLSHRWACYLQAALTRIQFGLQGHHMGSEKQDYGLFYDAEIGGSRAIVRIAMGCTADGSHRISRELTVDEHLALHQALSLAELEERTGKAIDVEKVVSAAVPHDIWAWMLEAFEGSPMVASMDPTPSSKPPTQLLEEAITQSVRAERNRWRNLRAAGVR